MAWRSSAAWNPRICERENPSHRIVEGRNHAVHHRRREALVPLPGFDIGRKIVQRFPCPLDRRIPEPWVLATEFLGVLKQELSSQSARLHIGQLPRKMLEDAPEIVDVSDDIFVAGVAQLEHPAGAAQARRPSSQQGGVLAGDGFADVEARDRPAPLGAPEQFVDEGIVPTDHRSQDRGASTDLDQQFGAERLVGRIEGFIRERDRDVAILVACFDGLLRDVVSLLAQAIERFGLDAAQKSLLSGSAQPGWDDDPQIDVRSKIRSVKRCALDTTVPPQRTNFASRSRYA